MRFRDLMLEVTGTENTENTSRQSVDVLDYVTIASVCMGIYKTKFLKEQYDVEVKMQDTDHIEIKPMKSTQKGFDVWDQETWKSSDMFLSENSQDHLVSENSSEVHWPMYHQKGTQRDLITAEVQYYGWSG